MKNIKSKRIIITKKSSENKKIEELISKPKNKKDNVLTL